MRVLVTGTKGQVVQALQELTAQRTDVQLQAIGRPVLELAKQDTIASALERAEGGLPDLVISAAAYTAVDQAEDEPELAHLINAKGPEALAVWCAQRNIPLIHLSTDYVFDGTADHAYAEIDETAPQGAYGRSKRAGEELVLAVHPDALIVRTAWVYSPFGSNFVKTMLRLAAERDEISVVADQRGNPTSAHDIAEGLLAMAAQITKSGHQGLAGVYHLVGKGEASWAEFAREIFAISEELGGPAAKVRNIATADFPTRAARPKNSRLSTQKLAKDFGWQAPGWQRSTRACVARLIEQD